MKKLLFIYNPTAGMGKIRARLGEIVDRFTAQDYEVTLHPTRGRGDATKFVRIRAREFDRIVCAGGDGTLNEVVTGLLNQTNPPPLGYIPTGTTNDFSRTLGLPCGRPLMAATYSVTGTPSKVDVGIFNKRPFIYVAAFGLFSDVSYTTPQKMKNVMGHLAYILNSIPQLASIPKYHLRVEYDGDHVVEGDYIYGMISDTISVGGVLDLDKDTVRLNDGKFEVLLVQRPKTPQELNDLIQALTKQIYTEKVLGFQTSHITLTGPEEIPWTLDGEFGGSHKTAEIHVLPQAVTLVTNPNAEALQEDEECEDDLEDEEFKQ